MIGTLLRRLDRRLFASNLLAYPRALEQALDDDFDSLLDVGCGARSPLAPVLGRIPLTVGVDAHEDAIHQSREAGTHSRYEQMDVLDVLEHFGPASFDVVTALDLVEHLDKPDGLRLLDVLEAVARRRVVVFTPNGFLPQGALDGNPWQVHRSGWSPREFVARGYRVTGINGWRPLRGEGWEPRVRPPALGHRLSAMTQPLVTRHPDRAFQLLAVKDQAPAASKEAPGAGC